MQRMTPERGFSALILPLVIAVLLLIGAAVFGGWAYSNMLDYKNNVNAKVDTAVAAAKQQEDAAKDAQFAQEAKQPLKTYKGPAAYGSVTIKYPKTWSAYIVDDSTGSPYINGYFYPDYVPDLNASSTALALRVQVVQDAYSSVISQVSGNITGGSTKVRAFTAAKVPGVVGVRIDGQLPNSKSGTMVVLPLRNMTLELWTEAPQFNDDFVQQILPNFSFAP